MVFNMTNYFESQILRRQNLGNYRRLQVVAPQIDFSSNDYLGLAQSTLLANNLREELANLGAFCHGSTGSRLLTGNTRYAQELEQEIALFHGYKAGLLFNCGYMANVGLLSAIATVQDTIFFDLNVHASMRDGIRLSRAKAFPFKHNNLEHLESRLKNHCCSGQRFVCIESIYSTDGTIAPLFEICALVEKYKAHLIVDEAHAVGVSGTVGEGLVASHNLNEKVFAQVTTFGKALGVYGAIVMGSNGLKEMLINFATSYIYTTALPLHALAAIKCSYALVPSLHVQRAQIVKLKEIFAQSGLINSDTHIQAIKFSSNKAVQRISTMLAQQGFDVRALMSPTVRRRKEVLRLCLHSFNTVEQLLRLLECIDKYE